jgi:hypothetical protein
MFGKTLGRWALVGAMVSAVAVGGTGIAQAASATTITIHDNTSTQRFHGQVSSPNSGCIAHRTVKVFKVTASGRSSRGEPLAARRATGTSRFTSRGRLLGPR